MPRASSDYSKGMIYKYIHNEDPNLVYVGSTTNFCVRKNCHKTSYYCETARTHNDKLYVAMRENGGFECFSIIKIKDFPCNSKRELELEEQKYMDELKSNLHNQRAFTSKDDRNARSRELAKRPESLEKHSKRMKKYREENKDKLKKYQTEKVTCECGEIVCKIKLKRHQETKKHKLFFDV